MNLPSRCTFFSLLLAAFTLSAVPAQAEAHCPGNAASFKPRIVAGALLVIPVKVNQAGPFDFMVDTGTQLNIIDPALAAQLNFKSQGTAGLLAATVHSQASVGVLDSLQAGSHTVLNPIVAVQDLGPIREADSRIRGILGENFLAHFDVLIDNSRPLLCLDDAKAMQDSLSGERVPLVASTHPETEAPFALRLVISVNLSDTGAQPILLQLDSGSDGPLLFAGNPKLEQPLLRRATPQGGEGNAARRAFAILPLQNMSVGSRIMRNVPFVTPALGSQAMPDREEDGLLATVLFHRLFVSHSDRYVIFDPK